MAQVVISDDIYARVAAFKPVVESILEEPLEFDGYFVAKHRHWLMG